jgi:glucose-1-phosphate thymidylyltransferase
MIDRGAKIRVVDVHGWYDAGEQGTLLETNRTMLERGRARRPTAVPADVTIVDPVYVEDGVSLRAATIGPNVSISQGSVVEQSTLQDTIIGADSRVTGSTLRNSMIGDAAIVEGVDGEVNVSDHSVVRIAHG